MNLKPVLHRVLVKPDDVSEVDEVVRRAKAAGIEVQLDKREQKAGVIGTVVKVGNTAFKDQGSSAETEGVVPGAKVYYAKYAGAETKEGGYIWLNDEDILGVIEDE